MSSVNPVPLIAAKRDGESLSKADLRALVDGYTEGTVPDYQMSAFLMAAYLNGLSAAEAAALTDAMLHSGTHIDLSSVPGTKVGKHSTGGVGDKVSPILVPLVASCGVPVAKLSGRGLGHTGGTIDKLESIPGFGTDLSVERYRRQVEEVGGVIAGQTGAVAPADKKIYALRDVTATVDSIPLIAASIMSKKLAEGNDALVLDVKCGRGAFMKTDADARTLAETLVAIGAEHDTPVVAVMTNMDVPLGRAVGNWPEIREAIACLRGEHADSALMEIVRGLAGEMIVLGGAAETPAEGREKARAAIESGAALDQFRSLVEAQGGDPTVLDDPDGRADSAPVAEVTAPPDAGGYVADLDALSIGQAAVKLGAGRQTKEASVDPIAGLTQLKKPGDPVDAGDVLARLHAGGTPDLEAVRAAVRSAYTFSDTPPAAAPALQARYDAEGWTRLSEGAAEEV
ncbi:pyrimidine-nucleoside phosphorylase [Salinibacter ruber]|uniref:thymidine phosphorylase n=1 Tax=Salinibacter ruber TaxID=146919 RepID=UPI002167BAEC|nr:thymidine phosphorylase [Salinibacter ruber]MCS3860925.1 pyrimidine-nucleoside phosphorylase [Salinibacter ruber]